MAHSPAMHSPHVIHSLNKSSEGMGFAPVSSHHAGPQVVRSHIPTPPRPMSNNNPGHGSMGQHTPPPPLNTTGDNQSDKKIDPDNVNPFLHKLFLNHDIIFYF